MNIAGSQDIAEMTTVCMFCERPTKDLNAVCKRIKCRLIVMWINFKYGREAKKDAKDEQKIMEQKNE